MTLYICTKCKAIVEINPLNKEAMNIIDNYEEIDKITGRSIEITCACKNPLTLFEDYIEETNEDVVIDYIIAQSMKDYQTLDEKIIESTEDSYLKSGAYEHGLEK